MPTGTFPVVPVTKHRRPAATATATATAAAAATTAAAANATATAPVIAAPGVRGAGRRMTRRSSRLAVERAQQEQLLREANEYYDRLYPHYLQQSLSQATAGRPLGRQPLTAPTDWATAPSSSGFPSVALPVRTPLSSNSPARQRPSRAREAEEAAVIATAAAAAAAAAARAVEAAANAAADYAVSRRPFTSEADRNRLFDLVYQLNSQKDVTMPSFKEEHILIIAPGSKTTLAQLGLPESFGPPAIRVPTRVFPTTDGQYHPNKIRAKKILVKRPAAATNGALAAAGGSNGQLSGVGGLNGTPISIETALPVAGEIEEEVIQYEEDAEDEEGAVFPIVKGRIVDHSALQALFSHIELLVSAPMHTPVLMVSDPAWTPADKERVAQFYFEKLQRPAISFITSPLAVCGGYGTTDACVIDIGWDKTTVSSILGFNVVEEGTVALNGLGGQSINRSLIAARHKVLDAGKATGPVFTENMVEQLKKQPYICEILQPDVPLPTDTPSATAGGNVAANPAAPAAPIAPTATAATASTGIEPEKPPPAAAAVTPTPTSLPRGPGIGTQTGIEGENADSDGVLDVASIVASGKASEILAKREQERVDKAPRGGNRKGGQEPARPVRLTNAQKAKVPFRYTERVKARELQAAGNEDTTSGASEVKTEHTPKVDDADDSYVYANREIEIGVERFAGCDQDGFLGPLTTAVIDAIAGAPPDKRQDLWNNLVIVGNGSKVKGLKERVLTHLLQTCLVSPNNNTMFTSELPSQFSTPFATGANTPQPGHHGASTPTPGGISSSAVNPLLIAATTASQMQNAGQQLAPPGQPYQTPTQPPSTPGGPQNAGAGPSINTPGGGPGAGGGSALPTLPHMPMHAPTSIKVVPPKDYYPEWKDHGFEEAIFLGACVMARVNFIMDQSQATSFMTRVQYNEEGPGGIHHYTLG